MSLLPCLITRSPLCSVSYLCKPLNGKAQTSWIFHRCSCIKLMMRLVSVCKWDKHLMLKVMTNIVMKFLGIFQSFTYSLYLLWHLFKFCHHTVSSNDCVSLSAVISKEFSFLFLSFCQLQIHNMANATERQTDRWKINEL